MAYYGAGYGYNPGTAYNSVQKLWDKLLHRQVMDKLFFKGLIGRDSGEGDGGVQDDISGFPIVEKTNLKKEAGDQITLTLMRQLTTSSRYNAGKTGTKQLVDAENTLTMHNVKVLIGHMRTGAAIFNKTTEQRSPFDLRKAAKDAISTELATLMDDGIFFALYSGFSFNIFREYGHATAVPVAHGNSVYGKDKSALTSMDSADVVDTDLMERLATAVTENNIPPARVKGDTAHLFIVHPRGLKTLRADSAWLDANAQGMPRGGENPIFSKADGKWASIAVMESNKIDSAKAWSGLTVSSDVITLAAATTTPLTATDVRANLLLGANAVARAFGKESYMAQRKEDDYGNIIGFAGGAVYGDKRTDWVIDDGSGATYPNQSSLLVYTYSPAVNSNLTAIWS